MDVVIVSAARTAIGKFGGTLAKIPASDLGAVTIDAVLKRVGIESKQVDAVILGQVLTAGCGQNPARQAAIKAGLPYQVPALTVNQVCGSGLKAVMLAVNEIVSGNAEIVIAGGQENMSISPHILPGSRQGFRLGHTKMLDSMLIDGLWDVFNQYHMGVTAENVAAQYNITREMQDTCALDSHSKAGAAQRDGKFIGEIVPVAIPQKNGETVFFSQDEGIRTTVTIEALNSLKPVFANTGTVTAGNASTINDGAAAVLLMSAKRAQQLNLIPMVSIAGFSQTGVDPSVMGIGPVSASQHCLAKVGWKIDDLDRIELNEAFAAQTIAVNKLMGWDVSKVNVNGGAIALGHPIGASGCRILVSLLYELQHSRMHKALASLCIGGGMGVALAVER